MKMDINRVY